MNVPESDVLSACLSIAHDDLRDQSDQPAVVVSFLIRLSAARIALWQHRRGFSLVRNTRTVLLLSAMLERRKDSALFIGTFGRILKKACILGCESGFLFVIGFLFSFSQEEYFSQTTDMSYMFPLTFSLLPERRKERDRQT